MPATLTNELLRHFRYLLYALNIVAMSGTLTMYAQNRGDCTENRWSQLNDSISYNCKGNGRGNSCNIEMTCSDLATNRDKFLSCGQARNTMMKECYKGGDPNHELASDDAFAAANRCVEVYKNPQHKPPC
jgi:hypothetical protein